MEELNKKELPFFPNPITENERLFNLQKRYKEQDPSAINDLYEKLREVAYKMINNISNSDRRVKALSAAERQQKAHDAATYLIEQYLKRPEFVITDSMTKYLITRVKKELYYARECDKMLVFSDELPEVSDERKQYRFIVEDPFGRQIEYATLEELRELFPKLRLDKLRQCIDTGELYKSYSITLLEIEA